MNFKRLPILIVFLLSFQQLMAQDKVNMLNGRIVEGELIDTTDQQVHIKAKNKKGKVYETYLENYRVFSIVSADGKETVLYKQDSTIGNLLTPEDMHFHILGEQDAYQNYKPIGTSIIGLGLAYGVVLFDTYGFKDDPANNLSKGLFKSSPTFLPILFPFVFTAVAGIAPRPNLDIRDINNKTNLNSEHYVQGFARTARFKRTIRALAFSCLGSALGVGSYYIFK